ncbi:MULTISPECIES: hypothetical protein [Enterococcus]|uniref:hypothetical protein n=1 Tax=Enterococcus TaxID=1350 RepID=UPI000B7908D6|nr:MULTISPECIES: hypothetical protein [Enterococcus]MCD5019842.1 hypothetical protein [Enterococcus faecium]MDK4378005.1 hypothetical protein [Enterococcus faecium]MDT2357563.1 hypothetical protein [Enterococcus faecium]OXC92708.1 hypothetical protein CBL16_14650 [Enterococcus faecalis]HAQ3903755.1 hypothetical protein [Enterococcus faecium]
MKKDGKEIVNDMEFLVNELHKEWDRSGVTKASVVISLEEVEEVNQVLLLRIAKTQELAEATEMTFKESMTLSRECYVLLRLARKIKGKEDKTNKKAVDLEISVPLDKEELKLFKELFGAKIK